MFFYGVQPALLLYPTPEHRLMTNSGENENNHKNSMELTRREDYEIYNGNRDERRNDWFTTRKPNRAGRRGAARCTKNWR